jgi:hypothetical protein
MKITISQDVVWRDMGGEIVILDLATQHYFGLTGAGNDIWHLIVEHGISEKIVERLIEKFEVEASVAQVDFDRIVHELAEKGMIKISSDESA